MVPEVRIENTSNMHNVEELLRILSLAYMIREEQQISILLDQMRRMEENQMFMMQELADMKQQLSVALKKMENGEINHGREKVLDSITEQVGKEAEAQSKHIQNIKTELNTNDLSEF